MWLIVKNSVRINRRCIWRRKYANSIQGLRLQHFYFHEYKLAIEVDESGHNNRNIDYEIQRQKAIEKELCCVFIRINPDEENFNVFKATNEIHRRIKKSLRNL